MFAGDMFLPAALMMISFLRSTIVSSRRRRSRRCRRCAASRRRRSPRRSSRAGCGSRPSPRRRARAARRPRPAGARCRGGPTVPILIRSGGLTAPTPQVSDMPHSSPSGMPIAWKNTSTSRGVGAAPTLTATASSSPSIARSPANSSRVALGGLRRDVLGHRLAGLLELDLRRARRQPGTVCSPCGERWPSRPALSFSQDPRHREEPRRLDGRQVGDDLARVRAGRHRHREDDRQVVVRHALGDVRRRQPRDHLRPVGELDHRRRADRAPPAGCGARAARPWAARSCRTCRSASRRRRARPRASAARGRSPGRRPRRRPRRPSSPRRPRRRRASRAPGGPPRASKAARNAPRRSPPSRPRRRRRRRSARRERPVDRERRRAERHRREVGDVELRPVGEHQRHGVARARRRARPGRRPARPRGRAAAPR